MSGWDAYRDRVVSDCVLGGGLFGKNCSTWSTTANFQLSQDNIASLVKLLDPNCSDPPTSVVINGDKYMNVTSPMDKGVHAMLQGPVNKKDDKSVKQQLLFVMPCCSGIVAAVSGTDKHDGGVLKCNVQTIADYLKSVNL